MLAGLKNFIAPPEVSADNGGWNLFRGGSSDGDSCSYSKVRRSKCTVVEDPDTKKPIKKCEKTEQLLKHCVGRPTEVVESNTEYTEEEVPNDQQLPLGRGYEEGPSESHRFFSDDNPENPLTRIPEFIEGQLSAGLEGFLQAAEEMANEVFGQFGFYKPGEEDTFERFRGRFGRDGMRGSPFEDGGDAAPGEDPNSSSFSDFSKGFREI